MKLNISVRMKVSASTPDEAAKAQALNDQIVRVQRRRAVLDESLAKDFNQLVAELGQLMNRADARRKRGRRG